MSSTPRHRLLPDRLNEEPVVFLSMTNSEIKYAALLCPGVWVPVSTLVARCWDLPDGLCAVPGLRVRQPVVDRQAPAGRQARQTPAVPRHRDPGLAAGSRSGAAHLVRESRSWDIHRWRTP